MWQFPLIDQGGYKGDNPKHDMEVTRTASGFKLWICKMQLAWNSTTFFRQMYIDLL
jgi:hypothetical protein